MTAGDPRFLTVEVAMAVHDRQIAEHGGLAGVKDHGLLESALARAVNKHAYGETDRRALALASGQMGEQELADWFRGHIA